MAALLIKNLPPPLHAWLKEEAVRNRRSMTQQTIVLLEQRMHGMRPVPFTRPVQSLKPIPADFFTRAIREGRDSR